MISVKKLIFKSESFFIYSYSIFFRYGFMFKVKNHISSLYSTWIGFHFKNRPVKLFSAGNFTIRGFEYIEMGDYCNWGKCCVLTAWEKYGTDKFKPCVIIGSNCNFGEYNHITSINKIIIGNGCLTGRWVTITDNAHGTSDYESLQINPMQRRLYSKAPVIIGNNVNNFAGGENWRRMYYCCKYSSDKRCTALFCCCRKSRCYFKNFMLRWQNR